MPPIGIHFKTSMQRTGKEYRELHEWLDGDAEKRAERHDITKIYDFGKEIEAKYGREGLDEYIRHIHDDVRAKFKHIEEDLQKAMSETLKYLGIRED